MDMASIQIMIDFINYEMNKTSSEIISISTLKYTSRNVTLSATNYAYGNSKSGWRNITNSVISDNFCYGPK